MDIRVLAVSSIFHPKASLRALKGEQVSRIAESIREIGLEHPVTVRSRRTLGGDDTTWEIVAGRHRYEAVKMLGHADISCNIMAGDERQARLWEIAENLHRADLTALERSEHVAEWVRLTADRGAQVVSPSGGKQPNDKGIKAASRELGINREDARRSVNVDSLAPEAKAVAVEMGLDDNRTALLAAAAQKTQADQIRSLRERAAEKDAKKQRDADEARKANRDTDKIIAERRLEAVKEYIAARLDVTEMHTLGEMLAGICEPLSRALMREAA